MGEIQRPGDVAVHHGLIGLGEERPRVFQGLLVVGGKVGVAQLFQAFAQVLLQAEKFPLLFVLLRRALTGLKRGHRRGRSLRRLFSGSLILLICRGIGMRRVLWLVLGRGLRSLRRGSFFFLLGLRLRRRRWRFFDHQDLRRARRRGRRGHLRGRGFRRRDIHELALLPLALWAPGEQQ